MAASFAGLSQALRRHRTQSLRVGTALLIVAGALVLGVRTHRRMPAARTDLARATDQATQMRDFQRAFSQATPSEEARQIALSDSLPLTVPRDLRVSIAEQIASDAERLGLRDVKVRFGARPDTGAPPPPPDFYGANVTVADYALALDCTGQFADVLSLVDQLPASVALERLNGERTKAGVAYHIVLAVFETTAATTTATSRAPAAAPRTNASLVDLIRYAAPASDVVVLAGAAAPVASSPGQPLATVRHDPFGPSAPQLVMASAPHAADTAAGPPKPPQWRVTATLLVAPRHAAVINDMLIYVGDSVPGGGTLTSVEHDRIVLTDPKGGSHTVAVTEGDG